MTLAPREPLNNWMENPKKSRSASAGTTPEMKLKEAGEASAQLPRNVT